MKDAVYGDGICSLHCQQQTPLFFSILIAIDCLDKGILIESESRYRRLYLCIKMGFVFLDQSLEFSILLYLLSHLIKMPFFTACSLLSSTERNLARLDGFTGAGCGRLSLVRSGG